MPHSHCGGSRRRDQPRRAGLGSGAVWSLVILAGLSSLLLLTACSEPRETPQHEVLAAAATATPAVETPFAATIPTPDVAPIPPAPTPTLAPTPQPVWPPTAVPVQEPAAPRPEPPAAPVIEAPTPPPDPVQPPAPSPAEASAPEPAPTPIGVAVTGQAGVIDRVVQLVNAARAEAGLAPLTTSPALMDSAQRQAQAIAEADRLTHTAPDGSPLESRVQAAGYGGGIALAEVLAAGPASPEGAVALWLASPEHRAYLLDPALMEIGVGYYHLSSSTYEHWWVADLGRR